MWGDEFGKRCPGYLQDLAVTLSLELAITHDDDEDGGWVSSRHEALMAIAAESGGNLSNLIAAEMGLDAEVDAAAHALLVAARPYVAFWGD